MGCASDRDNHNLNADRGSGGTQSSPSLDAGARFDLMEEVATHYRRKLDVRDIPLGGEAFVRGLASILFADRAAAPHR